MEYKTIEWDDISAKASISFFNTNNGAAECHLIIENKDKHLQAEDQFRNIETALNRLANSDDFQNVALVWKRYFVSDAQNQSELLTAQGGKTAISIVQQPALNESKVTVWAYFAQKAQLSVTPHGTVVIKRPAYEHFFTTQLHCRQRNEAMETYYIFDEYTEELARHSCTLKENCLRTWIYVHGVDVHYQRMSNARKAYFEKENLTDKTHYIASTGIEGKYIYPDSIVQMDAYAIKGIQSNQVTYLKGLSHLSPTIEYGVTFERTTAIDYGDRRHIFISGTASVDNKGQIVSPLHILGQLERSLENVTVLLTEGEATMQDVAQAIIYLRDPADYAVVNDYIEQKYPAIPKVIVWAPFHRPGLLVQIECIAIKEKENKNFEVF